MGTCQEASSIKHEHPANKGVHRAKEEVVGNAPDWTSLLNTSGKQPLSHRKHLK